MSDQEHLRGLCVTHPTKLGLYHGTGDNCVPACGRCAGHGLIRGIRFDLEASAYQPYEETCPQCGGDGKQPPHPIDLVQQLRREVGLFDGAMDKTPKAAWEEALAEVRRVKDIAESGKCWACEERSR